MLERYFDHAATTPVDPRVAEAMAPYLGEACGNAHSAHSLGRQARDAVERAREQVALLIGAEDPHQIVFTSGATEANNQVLSAYADSGLAISPFEHSSVRDPASFHGCQTLRNDGWNLTLDNEPSLLTVMTVNNETGVVLSAPDRASGTALLRDVTQHVGKLPLDLRGIDYATFSAHKLYGPKGVGALYTASGLIAPLLLGGGQEDDRRSGTLNVPGIVGFGAAAQIAAERMQEDEAQATELRASVLAELSGLSDWRENRHAMQSPYILSLSFLGLEAQSVLEAVDVRGYAVSGGAACSSKSIEPSHVLTAFGLEPEWLRGTIRISFGRSNTIDSAHGLASALVEGVETARKLQKSR